MFEEDGTKYQQIINVMNDNYYMQTVFYLTADSIYDKKNVPKTYLPDIKLNKPNSFLNH